MANASTTPKKKLYAARDFNDAGIEKQFTAGDDLSDEPGVENYRAAGLTSETKLDAPKEAAPAA